MVIFYRKSYHLDKKYIAKELFIEIQLIDSIKTKVVVEDKKNSVVENND